MEWPLKWDIVWKEIKKLGFQKNLKKYYSYGKYAKT